MKKSLLLTAALVASCSAFAWNASEKVDYRPTGGQFEIGPRVQAPMFDGNTRAAESIDFTYADEVYSALKLNGTTGGTTRVYMMIQMSEEDIKNYAGNQVVGFTVYSPTDSQGTSNSILDGRLFYTTNAADAQYSQDFAMSTTAFGANYVKLDKPYTITGDEPTLFFGYSVVVDKAEVMYYLPIDGVGNSYPGSCLFNASNDDNFPPADQWQSPASAYGALAMSIRIEGDNLPKDLANIADWDAPTYLPISGTPNACQVLIRNRGLNPVSSVELTASIEGSSDIKKTVSFTPINYNKVADVTFDGLKGETGGLQKMSVRITKVNGVDREGVAVETTVPVLDNGFTTNIVAEDATGTWCGWCPGGIEALDYLQKNYKDRAIGIGVHASNGSSKDPMEVASYLDFIRAYVSGFPTVLYNRTIQQTPTSPYPQMTAFVDAVAKYLDFPAYADVQLKAELNSDESVAKVTATSKFAFDTDAKHYLSFVLIEDHVGPYKQANYFRGQNIAMNGWETKTQSVSTYFNDVARYYNKFPGIENSIPAKIVANQENVYEIEIPLVEANGNKVVKGNLYSVVAMITNAETGRIINAKKLPMGAYVGVQNISADDNITVTGGNGTIIVNGTDNYSVYTTAGMKVANNNLPAGLYIVVANGKSAKVIVK